METLNLLIQVIDFQWDVSRGPKYYCKSLRILFSFLFLSQIPQRTKSLFGGSKNKFQWKQWYANAPEEVLCGRATLQSDGYYGALFWRQVIPNPNSTPSSANTLEALSGTIQLKEEHIPRFCLAPSDGITTWGSGGRLTAYIYARGCLMRLALLFPIGLRRKASAAHCPRNLIRRWCHLNEAKRSKTASEPHGERAWESFTSSLCFHGNGDDHAPHFFLDWPLREFSSWRCPHVWVWMRILNICPYVVSWYLCYSMLL